MFSILIVAAVDTDAEALEHVRQRLRREDRLPFVAGLVQPDDQAVADERRRPVACSDATSFTRTCADDGAGSDDEGGEGEDHVSIRIDASENLVQHANQPAGLEVVFHQAAAEVPDPQLADRASTSTTLFGSMSAVRTTPVSTTIWRSPLMSISRTPSSTRSPFGSTSTTRAVTMAVRSLLRDVVPAPLNFVLADGADERCRIDRLAAAGLSSPNSLVTDALALLDLSSDESAVPVAEMLSITRIVTRSLTRRAR